MMEWEETIRTRWAHKLMAGEKKADITFTSCAAALG